MEHNQAAFCFRIAVKDWLRVTSEKQPMEDFHKITKRELKLFVTH